MSVPAPCLWFQCLEIPDWAGSASKPKDAFFFSFLKPVGTCTFYLEFKNSSQEIVLLNAVCVPSAALALDATEGGNIQLWQWLRRQEPHTFWTMGKLHLDHNFEVWAPTRYHAERFWYKALELHRLNFRKSYHPHLLASDGFPGFQNNLAWKLLLIRLEEGPVFTPKLHLCECRNGCGNLEEKYTENL